MIRFAGLRRWAAERADAYSNWTEVVGRKVSRLLYRSSRVPYRLAYIGLTFEERSSLRVPTRMAREYAAVKKAYDDALGKPLPEQEEGALISSAGLMKDNYTGTNLLVCTVSGYPKETA